MEVHVRHVFADYRDLDVIRVMFLLEFYREFSYYLKQIVCEIVI